MELAYKLAPSIHGINETKDYFQIKLKTEGELHFIARFEGLPEKRDIHKESLSNYRLLSDLGTSHFQLSFVKTWLSMLIAPLDCYSWVFSERLLTPKNIFSSGKSCIWASLEYFIKNIINYDLQDIIKSVYSKNDKTLQTICTPHELEEFKSEKCTAIIRFIDFLCTMIGNYPSEAFELIPDHIWSEEFFSCLINLCLDPEAVGFDLSDLEVYTNLPIKTKTFFKIFFQNSKDTIKTKFRNISSILIGKKQEFNKIIENIVKRNDSTQELSDATITDWLKLSQLINGYEQLSEFNIYHLPLDLNRIIFDYLCEQKTSDSCEQESLTCIEAKNKLLGLCLGLNFKTNKQKNSNGDYLIEILDKYLFDSARNKEMTSFIAYYRNELFLWVCKRHEYVIDYLLGKLRLNFSKCIHLFVNLVEYICGDKNQRKTYGKKVVEK